MQDPNNPTNQNPQSPPLPGVTPPVPGVVPSTPGDPLMPSNSVSPMNTTGVTPSPTAPSVPGMQPAQSPQVGGSNPPASTPSDIAKSPTGGEQPAVPAVKPADASVKKEEPTDSKKDAAKTDDSQPQVKKADIEKVVSNWTGIPITKLTEDEGAKLLNLEKRIHQRLIDQEEAVTAVAEAVRRGRIGLAAANRPIASFIFLGPSGTGKTELAKTLAEILFGRDDAMVRLDMSEYMEKHEVAKLIGAPPGYVGYEEGGQLTEAVRAKPYSIVLLDEVEKAHPDVFNVLLQLLEDGRLTDNKGNTISFKNTIVICTSNIGSAQIVQKLGEKDGKPQTPEQIDKSFEELSSEVTIELRKFFRPELLNRYDDIVIFKPLRREDMAGVAKLGIEKTGKLLKEQDIKIKITDKAVQQLAVEGYDPMYGARPLRRLIQTSIENPIAVLIIAKTFVAGDTILIDYDQGKSDYSFKKATPEELAADAKKEDDAKMKKDGEKKDASTGSTQEKPEDQKQNPTDSSKNSSKNDTSPSVSSSPSQNTPQSTNGTAIPGVVPPASSPPPSPSTTPSPSGTTNGVGLGQGQPQ